MAIEVKQLVVKGTVLQEQESAPETSPTPPASASFGVDEEEVQAEFRRMWSAQQRQRQER